MPAAMSFHVVYIAPFGLRRKSTVWARTLPLAKHLVTFGHRAAILIPPWDSPEDAGTVELRDGVRLEHISLRGGLLPTLLRLYRRIHQLAPDLVHIIKPRAHAGLVHWLLAHRRTRPPLLLDLDDWEQAWNPVNRYPWAVARFLAWQEEWGIRHADGITAASAWLMQAAHIRAPATPRLYLPNGLDPVESFEARPPRRHSAPRILYFSRLVETTPAWLAACWQALLERLPDAQLLIAGDPVQPHLAPPFHAALDHLPGVTWLGYVPSERLPALYADVDCAIFPADPTPLQSAKCSVRLATTLLHGVPVVASAVGEQAAYGADGLATLVPPAASPVAFAAAIHQTLVRLPGDPDRLRQQLLTRYAWRDLAHRLEHFYAGFIAPHGAGAS